MKRKSKVTFFLGIAFFLLLTSCGQSKHVENKHLKIGVCIYDQKDTFISALTECFREDLEKTGLSSSDVTVTVRDAEKSQQLQNDQVEDLIEEGVNVLCINPVDRASLSDCIERARSADIPIIFFNREPVREDMESWDRLYYVGGDARESGELQGVLAAEYVKAHPRIDKNGDGKIQYVVLEGQAGHQDAVIRTETVGPSMEKSGISVEKLDTEVANWSRAQAFSRMQQLIVNHGTSIEMVLANNDDMALGAADTYKKLNYTEADCPAIFGIDGTEEGLQGVIDGSIAATVYNDKEAQAMMMAKLAVAASRDEDMSSLPLLDGNTYYAPYYKVTTENIRTFMRRQESMTGDTSLPVADETFSTDLPTEIS